MSNKQDNTIRLVKGSERYAGASDIDFSLQVNLEGDRRNYVDGDRSKVVNLAQIFDEERQTSTKFRISGKLNNIFNNVISGKTGYEYFEDYLYYINVGEVSSNYEDGQIPRGQWQGHPQHDEFSFFRTRGISNHVNFESKNADNYNWMMYVTYPFENDEEQTMKLTSFYNNEDLILPFTISDGIPYYVRNRKRRGKNLAYFYCGFKHNLNIGDWVYLRDGEKKYYEVYGLGDEFYGNEDKVFSVYDYGFEDEELNNSATGTLKRIIDINNSGETTSKYYVRKHKLLTNFEDYEITRAGFENLNFSKKVQLEYSGATPNLKQRVSIKESSQTVTFSFKSEIDINSLRDNNGRPLTQLFVSIINRGYMGWFNKPSSTTPGSTGIQIGWDFNLLNHTVDTWWNTSNIYNRDNSLTTSSYENLDKVFFYNTELSKDDIIKGDICEWNDYEQKETVLSDIHHKYSFNHNIFYDSSTNTLPNGYAYKVHYPIDTRVFSDFVETGDKDQVDNIPDYAFYSKYESQWRWRDLYYYGFLDTDNNGEDHPFLNGMHYPFKDILFLQTPIVQDIGINNNIFNNIVIQPNIDDCE